MSSLFSENHILLNPPNANLEYIPDFYSKEESLILFETLLNEIPWKLEPIKVFGKEYLQPRLTALFGNQGKSYSYSNITMQPNEWNKILLSIKNRVEAYCNIEFTTVLLNLYRDGNDSNGWHADNEKELGINPYIASLSFGAARDFHLKHNSLKDEKLKFQLESGSLLLMKGETQHYWKHQIPKTKKEVGPRINLTFRVLK